MEDNKYICFFCQREVKVGGGDTEFSYEVDSYLHLSCLEKAFNNDEDFDSDIMLIANEMNEKGYELGKEED